MILAGIDYSLTSPSICVHEGTTWDVKNCKFYYLVKREKSVVTAGQFYGQAYPEYICDAHRYDNLAKWSLGVMKTNKVEEAFIEGYAFAAVGRVFQIAENCGMLKHKMWEGKIPFDIYPPSQIKKAATTKGNANKEVMYDHFVAETGIDIRAKLCIASVKQWNPISDIVDAYYICKLGHSNIIAISPDHSIQP